LVKPNATKGTKITAVADAAGFSLALHVASASPNEATLAEDTLNRTYINELPSRLIGDKAYDSDKLDASLKEAWGIEMIAPIRKKRTKSLAFIFLVATPQRVRLELRLIGPIRVHVGQQHANDKKPQRVALWS
jgi:hypothetical protein